jgi:hypothetical protein
VTVPGQIGVNADLDVDDLEREAEHKALGIDGKHLHHVTHWIEPVESREPPINRNRLREFDFSG